MYEWADCDHLNLISLETISSHGPSEFWKTSLECYKWEYNIKGKICSRFII